MAYIRVGDCIKCEVCEVNGKRKIINGVLRDIGWEFIWGEELPQNFLIRIIFSRVWEDFLQEWNKEIENPFETFKGILLDYTEEQLKYAIYVLSGDNRLWHFGEDFNYAEEDVRWHLIEYGGYKGEKLEEVENEFWNWVEGISEYTSFDIVYGKHKEDWSCSYGEEIKKTGNFKELELALESLKREFYGEVMDQYRSFLFEKVMEFLKILHNKEDIA